MIYKNKKVEFIQLVCYLGEEFKGNTYKENEEIFSQKISDTISFPYSYECPIEDMICLNHEGINQERLLIPTKEDMEALISGLEELKESFPNSFLNLNLDGFIEEEGNSIDLTIEEFRSLYSV